MLGLFKPFDGDFEPSRPQKFQYDFATSGYERIDRVRFLIEDQPEWDYCHDKMRAVEHIKSAADRFGFGPHFCDEQRALCRLLSHLNAGPSITTYAWGLYRDLTEDVSEETLAA